MENTYLKYWGLNQKPFEESVDQNFYFESKIHLEGLSRLQYFIEDGNMHIALLTGEVGAGKTLICDKAINAVSKLDYTIFIENSYLTFDDLIGELIFTLSKKRIDKEVITNSYMLSKVFETLVIKKLSRENKKLIIILDECQLMSIDEILKLRMLSNINRFDNKISLILSGQPELRTVIRDIPQLNQRIGLRYHLKALSFDDCTQYIQFRLRQAGCFKNIFDDETYELIYSETRGIPRLINRHCKLALHFCAVYNKQRIDASTFALIIDDLLKHDAVALVD
ncbi:MAG: hypothetical protein COA79_20545 [Planctomycetota bacterium]|nr:MAG: hypothetical protein COA79_20545 [Planctomycetota bacterium]